MRKRNKVVQLNRDASHRKAMLSNLVKSLLYHERISSTTAKAKAAQKLTEKLISRAKKNLEEGLSEAQKVHNVRLANRVIKDKELLYKLFHDIAPRFQERPGGYTRVLKIGRRNSDKSEMAMVELVERKEIAQLKDDRKDVRARWKSSSKDASSSIATSTSEPKEKKSLFKKK